MYQNKKRLYTNAIKENRNVLEINQSALEMERPL